MGDPARFRLFAELIAARHPNRESRIADVAGGKGGLRSALHVRGYRNVVTWDRRKCTAGNREDRRYAFFKASVRERYDLVVGMHPDGGTDQVIAYAARNRVPYLVVPCCIVPTCSQFWGWEKVLRGDYGRWLDHLEDFASKQGLKVERLRLPMEGRNIVLAGGPTEGGEAMTFDPSKLTPAPWLWRDGVLVTGNPGQRANSYVATGDFEGFVAMVVEDAEFVCLARKAFDVMMRRGWGVLPPANGVGWRVMAPTASMDAWTFKNEFADPFTALVEADRWYAENVERTP